MFNTLLTFINHIPDLSWNWLGKWGPYDSSQDNNPLSVTFWWRELWHFLGGCLLGLIGLLLISKILVVGLVLISMSLVEWFTDRDWKSFVDVTFWTLGAGFASWLL